MKIRLLSARDVRLALPPRVALEAAREAFQQLAEGQARLPLRTALQTEDGVMLFMPGHLPQTGALAQKMVGVFPGNPALGLSTINGLVLVFDATTGLPRALLEGRTLTAIRTGAASALATDLLARTESRVLALCGAGGQAYDQALGVCTVRNIEDIRIVSAGGVHCRELAARLQAEGYPARSMATATEALRGADVVCCATTSCEPLFEDADLASGTHINAIGAYTPQMCEVPPATVARAYIVVDQAEAARTEAGDLLQPLSAGLLDESCFSLTLGDLVTNRTAGRTSAAQITLYKSVGLAVQDLTAAARAVAVAETQNLGQAIELG